MRWSCFQLIPQSRCDPHRRRPASGKVAPPRHCLGLGHHPGVPWTAQRPRSRSAERCLPSADEGAGGILVSASTFWGGETAFGQSWVLRLS